MRGFWKLLGIGLLAGCRSNEVVHLLNASFDPTRTLYEAINEDFARTWLDSTGQHVEIAQSHGGSGKQARAVLDGLQADLVSLALPDDIDQISRRGNLIDPLWSTRAPDGSVPFHSAIVFVVRRGNPFGIGDWADLARPGLQVVTPNPKTSGGARWNWLAAWGASRLEGLDSLATARRCQAIWKNVPVQDASSRAATTTFALRGIGDVLVTWENEALLVARELPEDGFEIVRPAISIRADPPVAVVDSICARRNTCEAARAWLAHLWRPSSQEAAAREGFRPSDTTVLRSHSRDMPDMRLFAAESVFGSWETIQREQFGDSGIFVNLVLGGRP
ncbi:MAG: sulfate ABC transporter substrate-binding protein [Fibrobacteria bacterium]|nr:sulfate ABC transporter substrate-binding protein [Fibrobacteria bacterium]